MLTMQNAERHGKWLKQKLTGLMSLFLLTLDLLRLVAKLKRVLSPSRYSA